MKKRTTLLARIARIERQRQPREQVGRRVASMISGRLQDEITGFSDMRDHHCPRDVGEEIESLISRAFAVTGAIFIYAIYETATAAPERDCEPEWPSAPSQA